MNHAFSWPLLTILLGVSGSIIALLQVFCSDTRVDERIREYQRNRSQNQLHNAEHAFTRDVPKLFAWLIPNNRNSLELRRRLLYAGYDAPSALGWFITIQFLLMGVIGGVGGWVSVVALNPPQIDWRLFSIAGASVGYLVPGLWLNRRKAMRQLTLSRSLPDLLDLMVSCLNAGLSLEAVIQRIASEKNFGHPELTVELGRIQHEIEMGATVDRAFLNFARRSDSDEIRSLGVLFRQSRKFGAQVTSTLSAQADILREQREQQAEEAAQKAAVRILAPTLLCLFPVIFIVLAGPAVIQINEQLTDSKGEMTSGE